MIRRILVLSVLSALLAACGGAKAENAKHAEKAENAEKAGKAEGTMQGRWWAWAAAEPEATNPVSDLSGEDCARNQTADVWFLAGTFGLEAQRRCSVPAGRPIVLPAVNKFDVKPSGCADFMRSVTGSVELDGVSVPLDRIDGESIAFEAAADNALGTERGPVRATGCGLWARMSQVSPGTHQLRIRGGSGSFAVAVDYTLEVSAH
jgi:hypothetical protein